MRRKFITVLAALLTVCIVAMIIAFRITKPTIVVHGDFVDNGYGFAEQLKFEANIAETNKDLESNDFLEKVKRACIDDQELVKTWKRKDVEFRFETEIGSITLWTKYPTYSMQRVSFKDLSYHYSTSIYDTPEEGLANYKLVQKQDRVKAVVFALATEELQKERVGQAEINEQYAMQRFDLLKNYPGDKFNYDWWKRAVTEEMERLINKFPETKGAIKMRAFLQDLKTARINRVTSAHEEHLRTSFFSVRCQIQNQHN